jgi:hypothetical protein
MIICTRKRGQKRPLSHRLLVQLGEVEGGAARAVELPPVHTALKQERCGLNAPTARGCHQCRVPSLGGVGLVHVGSGCQEILEHRRVVVLGGEIQRGPPVRVARIDAQRGGTIAEPGLRFVMGAIGGRLAEQRATGQWVCQQRPLQYPWWQHPQRTCCVATHPINLREPGARDAQESLCCLQRGRTCSNTLSPPGLRGDQRQVAAGSAAGSAASSAAGSAAGSAAADLVGPRVAGVLRRRQRLARAQEPAVPSPVKRTGDAVGLSSRHPTRPQYGTGSVALLLLLAVHSIVICPSSQDQGKDRRKMLRRWQSHPSAFKPGTRRRLRYSRPLLLHTTA